MAGACELPGDARDLLGGLRLAEDDLRDALAKGAVVVDRRIAELGERQVLQPGHRLVDGGVAADQLFQQVTEAGRFHGVTQASTRPTRRRQGRV